MAGPYIGAILFAAIGNRLSRYATFVGMFVVASLMYWCLAFFLPFPVILVAATISGFAAGPLNPIIDTVLLERTPAEMRGRVLGTITAAAWMTMPLGMLVSGFLTERFGLQPLLIGLGTVYVITTVSAIFIPVMRELNRSPQAPITPTAEGGG